MRQPILLPFGKRFAVPVNCQHELMRLLPDLEIAKTASRRSIGRHNKQGVHGIMLQVSHHTPFSNTIRITSSSATAALTVFCCMAVFRPSWTVPERRAFSGCIERFIP